MREFISGKAYVIERDGTGEVFRSILIKEVPGPRGVLWQLYRVESPQTVIEDAQTGALRPIEFIATVEASPPRWTGWPMGTQNFRTDCDPEGVTRIEPEMYIPLGLGAVRPEGGANGNG